MKIIYRILTDKKNPEVFLYQCPCGCTFATIKDLSSHQQEPCQHPDVLKEREKN